MFLFGVGRQNLKTWRDNKGVKPKYLFFLHDKLLPSWGTTVGHQAEWFSPCNGSQY